MVDSFSCPHCERAYPVLPTLVGRAVRCSNCKQAFKLGYDGVALKIKAGAASEDSGVEHSALESNKKPVARVDEPQVKAVEKKRGQPQKSTGVRPQTRAIKNHTAKIKKIRESLQAAAEQASASAPGEEAPSQESGERQSGASHPNVAPSIEPVRRVKKQRKNTGFYLCLMLGVLLLGGVIFWPSSGPVVRTLEDFGQATQLEYPDRLNEYRRRMWITARQDGELPIVVSVKDAQVVSAVRFDWIDVVSACSPELDDLIMNDAFGIWHAEKDRPLIESAWKSFNKHAAVELFYDQLSRNDVRFFRYDHFQELLLRKGVPKELVYAVSLLLAGSLSSDALFDRQNWLGSDNMPAEIYLAEFRGRDGQTLVDAGGFYGVETAPYYAGLVLGFLQSMDDFSYNNSWRILDLRMDTGFKKYYNAGSNPLMQLHRAALAELRRQQAFSNPDTNGG